MWTWDDVNEAYLETLAGKYPALTKFIASIGVIHSKAMAAYLIYMAQRIIEMHRVLKDTGSLYLHCDPTASHYLKVVLDEIFGDKNFRNEIIWCYTGGTDTKTTWQKKHDIILFYTKTNDYVLNPCYSPFNENTIKRFNKIDENGRRYKINKLKDGRITTTYMKEGGKLTPDYWNFPIVNITSKEGTGYPTQKPLALLHRIIKASSNEGDIVMDPFCGCATTCVAAQQLGRKWIGIDIEKQARKILIERLSDDAGMFKDFTHTEIVPQRDDVQIIDKNAEGVKERLYREQNGICNGCKTHFNMRNMEIDHIIPESKGGGSYYENYQLLCSYCNKLKGARPMEYLLKRWDKEEEFAKIKITFGK
jgi:site-specific DNA-methyltransferase (adenine-specific)